MKPRQSWGPVAVGVSATLAYNGVADVEADFVNGIIFYLAGVSLGWGMIWIRGES